MDDEKKCDFLLMQLKHELAAQANVFDQIDNKTGVALGFTFIAVGQVLAAVFRMATDQNHFRTLHACLVGECFVLANISVFLAVIMGAVARWPREFHTSVTWSKRDLDGTCIEIKNKVIEEFLAFTKTNEQTNRNKGSWAKATYFAVGVALVFYLVLSVLLYMYSIPK